MMRSVAHVLCWIGLATYAMSAGAQTSGFPHDRHARLFIECATCHVGVTETGQALWPAPSTCNACHDGTVAARVTWTPRAEPRPTNLRFSHDGHARAVTTRRPADSTLRGSCAECHVPSGSGRMSIVRAALPQCLTCHGVTTAHFDAPATACATCHVPITQAPRISAERIARFPKPASHDAAGFAGGGHGRGIDASLPSCATCHARTLCVDCHVNTIESPPIRSLMTDERMRARERMVAAPTSHSSHDFSRSHGAGAQRTGATCATCHTRESCATCHTSTLPPSAQTLAAAGTGRAAGVHTERRRPPSHTTAFTDGAHAPDASARPRSCETCHARTTCLSCHRPDATKRNAYHPASFLTRHPASAYSREANCADCHNAAQFCQSCHQRSGLTAVAKLGRAGYHDAFRGFSLGHGQAARQSLETCASCHAERDCTACHSAVGGGFRFSPHGPGFDAERMRAKNPSVCVACHGVAIPRRRN